MASQVDVVEEHPLAAAGHVERLAILSERRMANLLEKLVREQKWPRGY